LLNGLLSDNTPLWTTHLFGGPSPIGPRQSLIHRSEWKRCSQKFTDRFLRSGAPHRGSQASRYVSGARGSPCFIWSSSYLCASVRRASSLESQSSSSRVRRVAREAASISRAKLLRYSGGSMRLPSAARLPLRSRGPWLCVPASRRVCLCRGQVHPSRPSMLHSVFIDPSAWKRHSGKFGCRGSTKEGRVLWPGPLPKGSLRAPRRSRRLPRSSLEVRAAEVNG
jgi:hypothetical protein